MTNLGRMAETRIRVGWRGLLRTRGQRGQDSNGSRKILESGIKMGFRGVRRTLRR